MPVRGQSRSATRHSMAQDRSPSTPTKGLGKLTNYNSRKMWVENLLVV